MLRIAKGKTGGSIYELSSLKSSLFPFYIYTFPRKTWEFPAFKFIKKPKLFHYINLFNLSKH